MYQSCVPQQCFKNYENFSKVNRNFIEAIVNKGFDQYDQLKCHPLIAQHVTPRVQIIWDMFPFTLFFGSFSTIIDACLTPCCWWILWPLELCIVYPWNTVWTLIIFTVTLIIFSPCICCCGCCAGLYFVYSAFGSSSSSSSTTSK